MTHRHAAFFCLVFPLLRASGKDEAMKGIPKTPVEFDYDLWTTEDGKCMVRIKSTGEVTEVDREVMKALRAEEKWMRRKMTGAPVPGAEEATATVLSLDFVSFEGGEDMSPAWLEDPHDYAEDMMKQGKYVGGYAPYGYVLHPTIRNKLKLDPEAANIVRRIFDEALLGRNTSQIALGLNDDNTPTPGQYFRTKHPDKKKFSRMSEKVSWTAAMVYKLLVSYVYTGATVGHKRKSCGIGTRKSIAQEQEDWIIVDGMHEAIVSKEEFELAQSVIRGGEKKPVRKHQKYPLKGLVCCGNCKRVMTRRKHKNCSVTYQCCHSTHDRDTDCPVGERYDEKVIEASVYNAIGQYLMLAEKQAVQNREVGDLRKAAIRECADSIRNLQKQSDQLKSAKLRLYEKYTSGLITREEYRKQKAEADAKLAENEEAIRQEHERMQTLDSEQSCSDSRLEAVCDAYRDSSVLTYELAHSFVKSIFIHGHDNIEIVWKFRDIYEDTEGKK